MIPSQPIRIFDRLTIVTDPVTGEVRHEGDYVEFFRKASDPLPATIGEARALLARQVAKDSALVTIVTKKRAGLTDAQEVIAAVKELRASARPEAVKWKADAKAVEVVGGSLVAVEAKAVEEAPAEEKAVVDVKAQPEVKP